MEPRKRDVALELWVSMKMGKGLGCKVSRRALGLEKVHVETAATVLVGKHSLFPLKGWFQPLQEPPESPTPDCLEWLCPEVHGIA